MVLNLDGRYFSVHFYYSLHWVHEAYMYSSVYIKYLAIQILFLKKEAPPGIPVQAKVLELLVLFITSSCTAVSDAPGAGPPSAS